ncbi:hypothetical protein BAE44_0013009 [Dichanthelium oligosanthes]|uniref:UBP-type domain-containing protein n=1 Tax=Dichanthelium oligosanthes TaxID=888268 RepID=A0A1E5VLH4_9POAL|nr:hypothetical protein BAE44_0013009 [Dichanthelium oligosanthes]
MSSAAGEDSSSPPKGKEKEDDGARREEGVEVDLGDLYGAAAGWVEARTSCPHLGTMPPAGAVDLARVPPPDSPCSRFGSSSSCSDYLRIFLQSSQFKFREQIMYIMFCSDLSVWCFACDSYLDVQAISELRPVYEVAHLLKFGERPPFRSLEVLDLTTGEKGSSSSGA